MNRFWIHSFFCPELHETKSIPSHITTIFILVYGNCMDTTDSLAILRQNSPVWKQLDHIFLVFELPRKDLPVNRFLDLGGILLWMWELWFRLVKLFEKHRLVLGLPLGQPQQTLQVLHFVSQVVVGFLQDLNFLRKSFNLFLFFKKSFLHRGAQEL